MSDQGELFGKPPPRALPAAPPGRYKYVLTAADLALLADFLARMRTAYPHATSPTRSHLPVDFWHQHIGYGAQIGVARLLGIDPALHVGKDRGWNYDFNGYRIETRATAHWQGRLIFQNPPLEARVRPTFVLAVVNEVTVYPRGMIAYEASLARRYTTSIHDNRCEVCDQDKLGDFAGLWMPNFTPR